jgi:hypothetical protein
VQFDIEILDVRVSLPLPRLTSPGWLGRLLCNLRSQRDGHGCIHGGRISFRGEIDVEKEKSRLLHVSVDIMGVSLLCPCLCDSPALVCVTAPLGGEVADDPYVSDGSSFPQFVCRSRRAFSTWAASTQHRIGVSWICWFVGCSCALVCMLQAHLF